MSGRIFISMGCPGEGEIFPGATYGRKLLRFSRLERQLEEIAEIEGYRGWR